MIKGIGVDLIELGRIRLAIEKNERFIQRVLTEKEREVYDKLNKTSRKVEYLAGRFAAKEAFAKACGTGLGKLSLQHIEILSTENGAPTLTANGYEKEKIFLSISHSETYAIAQVVLME